MQYKGEPLTIERFRGLLVDAGIDIEKPVSARAINRAGLKHPMRLFADRYGSYNHALSRCGLLPFDVHQAQQTAANLDEAVLKGHLKEYVPNGKTVSISAMGCDYDPQRFPSNEGKPKEAQMTGALLAARLQQFSFTELDGPRSVTPALQYFGYRPLVKHQAHENFLQVLRTYWPKTDIDKAYAGELQLKPAKDLRVINPAVFKKLHRIGVSRIVNELYSEFPDLQNYVVDRGTLEPAHPRILAEQIRDRFYAGKRVNAQLLRSTDYHEKLFAKRVLSLRQLPQYKDRHFIDIVRSIVPELSRRDLIASPGALRRSGIIGNLLVEWMMRWTAEINPNGFGYDAGFRKALGMPNAEVHAERAVWGRKESKVPDIIGLGKTPTIVEVRHGEEPKNVATLVDKYDGSPLFFNDQKIIDPQFTAVLHTPERVSQQVRRKLGDAGYTVVDAEEFLASFEKFIKNIPDGVWEEAAPRLHSPEMFIDFYKQFAFAPASMMRATMTSTTEYVKDTLEKLVNHHFVA